LTIRRFFRHRMAVFGTLLMIGLLLFVLGGSLFYSEDYANSPVLNQAFQPPTEAHPAGTDQVGRDVLARLIYGGQISVVIGITVAILSVSIGTVVGLISGYFAGTRYGWVDSILMRIVEALLAFPILLLVLLLSSAFARSDTELLILGRRISVTVLVLVMLLGFTSWMGLSRIVRSLVLSLREREFVLSARTVGASDLRIIFIHILPSCIAPIVVTATLDVGGAIVTESYLSFLGFGVRPPTATWGNIMETVANSFDKWWLWLFPGICIMLITLAINFIGDGLRDALDPRSIK
jgi:peptide/nickel transport system permease protein